VALCMAGLTAACGVPDYNLQAKPDAGDGQGGAPWAGGGSGIATGGSTAASGGASATATGGQQQDPFNCAKNDDCSTFSATKICDTSTRRCVECLPSVTTCGIGLYCGTDKVCHIGCGSDADCGEVTQCDASTCDALKCDMETHECKGCLSDRDCKSGSVCDSMTDTCVASCVNSTTCPPGWTCCAQGCVNLQSDNENCASCGTRCDKAGANTQCLNGTCRIESCKQDFLDCDKRYENGCETNKLDDNANCGACGTICTEPQICKDGACGDPACTMGYANCDNNQQNGCETNTDSNVLNCGACNLKCSTINGTPTCSSGQCAITCASGFGDCDQQVGTGCEVDLSNSAVNCGGCGVACTNDHGGVSCSGGKCSPSCGTGFADCDGNPANGCETAKSTDVNNCGGCGNLCNLANATAACTNGTCTVASCTEGFFDCNHDPADGCESNPLNDAKNCSACGSACNGTNGTPSCQGGICSITCNSGFQDCDEDPVNGCEVNLMGSVNNCGTCSKVCPDQPNGTATCRSGECGVSNCASPYGDCDGDGNTGCETNTNIDPQNCSGCGNKCVIPNATAVCTLGVCGVGTCNEGFADCNGDPKDGCEVNLKADVNNCSACGSRCAPANAVGSCVNGACTVTSCTPPYQDCNGLPSDGCEANTHASVSNCGACGTVCDSTHGTPSCAYGVCSISCSTGYGNCDGDVRNGCEANTTTDALNCGSCLNMCVVANGPLGRCVNSACVVDTCSTGFADCNGKYPDGCEARLTTDTANCGGCGNICNSTSGVASCANGTCSVSCAPGFGDCNGLPADGCEIDLGTSLQHCGACGKSCAPPNGTGTCSGGACSIVTCAAGHRDCNALVSDGCESNLMTDVMHCGDCTTICNLPNATASCNSGVCAIQSCNAGYADCDGNPANGCEVNKNSNTAHCGGCNNACNSTNGTATCTSGSCGITCNSGFGNCDNSLANGCEINLNSDVNNCRTCGSRCPSSSGGTPVCTAGTCGYSTCPTGFAECDTNPATVCETNVKGTDINNCGNCGTVCSLPNATPKCTAGVCGIQSCNAGFADCDGNAANGCEVNLKADVNNCNACGTKCSAANGTPACSNGVCSITCNSGYSNCNNNPSDGCEAALNTTTNCGSCGNTCSTNNGTASCTGGTCGISCNSGYANCDNNVANGCEVNLRTDPVHCGSCTTVCNSTNGTATCSNSVCGITCSAGYGNCDNNAANGCETNTSNNVNYCGSCSNVCNSTNGIASCSGGTCGITCNAGYGNCDNNAANGCESNFATNAAHCGNCSTACVYSHAAGVCNAGSCQMGSCEANYGNCDSSSSTGCEAPLDTVSNCNACGVTCSNSHGTTACTGGVCAPSCDAGYASCDNNANNGCEQNVSADVTHCGNCTTVCQYANATPLCSGGACSMGACSYLYGNCNNNPSDGCERSLSGDVANCGACGNVCNGTNGTPSCSSGACSITCSSNYRNCDGNLSNGCEVNINTDPNNCGNCGTTCTYGCTNGRCNTPCSAYCSNPTSFSMASSTNYNSPNLGTGAACYETITSYTLKGGNCNNFASGRNLYVNGTQMNCANWGTPPAPVNGGYCVYTTAGDYAWAVFATWR